MLITAKKGIYLVQRMPSIFTSRRGKQDCYISRRCQTHGKRENDGRLYACVARFAAESGEVLRDHEPLPNEITPEELRRLGFLDQTA